MQTLDQDLDPRTHDALRQLAVGQAAGLTLQFICNKENPYADRQGWYEGYRYLYDCVVKHQEPSDELVEMPEHLNHLEWPEVLGLILDDAKSIEQQMQEVLRLAFMGLVSESEFLGLVQTNTTTTVSLSNIDHKHLVSVGQHVERCAQKQGATS